LCEVISQLASDFNIFGIILLVGATSILDLRLMGLTFRDESVSKLAGRFIP
jgi:hypothetical protein